MPGNIRFLAARSARFLYRLLPLPPNIKWHLKSFLYGHLGVLFKNSTNYQQWLIQTTTTPSAIIKTPNLTQSMAIKAFSSPDSTNGIVYLENSGYCPICEKGVIFRSNHHWLRDNYFCLSCNTIPRQRALVYFLNLFHHGWKNQSIHESSPSLDYFIKNCPHYTFSYFFENVATGSTINGNRCENLEQMTFGDETFDIFITQDVMEHLFNPNKALNEIMRVLKKDGIYIFTVPKYKSLLNSYPRATLKDGEIVYIHPPNYHGNPIGDGKSLVTWDYGCDFEDLVKRWSGYNLSTLVLRDRYFGIDGEFLEVFIIKKGLVNQLIQPVDLEIQ